MDEVARIHGEMEKIKEEVGFEGTLQDFFEFMRTNEQFYYANDSLGKQKYIAEATEIINTMKANNMNEYYFPILRNPYQQYY